MLMMRANFENGEYVTLVCHLQRMAPFGYRSKRMETRAEGMTTAAPLSHEGFEPKHQQKNDGPMLQRGQQVQLK